MKCLTLLASTGDEPEWRDRHRSRGHQAIPLPSADIVEQAPMVAQLINQLGVPLPQLCKDPDRSPLGACRTISSATYPPIDKPQPRA